MRRVLLSAVSGNLKMNLLNRSEEEILGALFSAAFIANGRPIKYKNISNNWRDDTIDIFEDGLQLAKEYLKFIDKKNQ